MLEAAAQFKKQDGKLTVSADGRTVSWEANSGSPMLDIAVAEIGNLQQTPATAAKASIKVVVQKSPDQTEAYTFTFTSAAARDDQQAITGALRKWIEAWKAQAAVTPVATPRADGSSASAAMTIAQTVVGAGKPREDAYDDAKLLADIELQRSLLNSNPALRQRFDQAVRDKPETITIGQISNQFWATRVHLLRSHAAEKAQGAGTYNVLSVVKPKNEGGQFKLNMSKEQIQLIFAQHPLVKKVYNENVPGMSEGDFWSRFFNSRLVKKLRGEKITDVDPTDPKLDKYLNLDDDADNAPSLVMPSLPHFLDVEGNEQNHSQRLGNRPDLTMRPNTNEKVPILRVLNRMSEKMMADVPPSDADRHAPAGLDEETYKELQLRDLQRAADDNRIILKVQDQSQFFSAGQGLHTSSSAATYAKRTPAQVLSIMQQEFKNMPAGQGQNGGIDLQAAIGVEDESSSDEEASAKKVKVGSRSSRAAATSQIVRAIRKRHLHNDDYLSSQVTPTGEQAHKLGLSEQVFDNLAMTHNTTIEFLHYFWAVFYSGDPERANEVAKLIETLDKSLDRIKAVADTAESERTSSIENTKREIEIVAQRTGRRRKFDPNSIKGGAKVVNTIVEPLIRAIHTARKQYQTALSEQMPRTNLLNPN
ncbi:RNA polymerase II transcription factor-like protein [Lentithecium fluviatile CBS 122367]|uniref:RNA polymerase II transcription factor-like protein n=1 Tax=Lentithecium fluviatile CBS 122367 TaxID=1168545 RepID=A0A6G1IK95_9PLEO|nr:RNA polymerase II transcription factor-like protein [Lentithecium fluviatile CBS 122367]